MKIAILGAAGYLGSYLCQYLELHHTVIPVTRDTVDLTDYEAVDTWLSQTTPDVIVNCAVSGGGRRVDDINYTDVQTDFGIFLNFYNNPAVRKYINIGSGGEFDRRTSITNAEERDILHATPLETYSYTKNIIARTILRRNGFYTLRVFGCFDGSEPEIRLFKKFKATGKITIQDKLFDYISSEDFARIVLHYCESTDLFKDLNCVYKDKTTLLAALQIFAKHHVPDGQIEVTGKGLNYTGSGINLSRLAIPLAGLEQGIKHYG